MFRDPLQGTTSHIFTSILRLLLAACFSDFLCFWRSWQLWGVLVMRFVECPLPMVCLMVRRGYGFEGGRSQSQSAVLIPLWLRYVLSTWHHCGCWPWSPVSVQCTVTPSPPVSIPSSLEGRVGTCAPPPWQQSICVNYLKFFCTKDLSPLLHSFIYSITYFISMDSQIFILCFEL